MREFTQNEWDHFLSQFQNFHILQDAAWGQLKSTFGWDVARVAAGDAGAQILFKKLPLGFSWAYIPKGPVGADWEYLWPVVDEICRRRRSVFLKVEPDLWEEDQETLLEGPLPPGFRLSPHSIQPPRTLVVNLDASQEEILSQMKQKTRYNIRLSNRKGVKVVESSNVEKFHQMMQVTGNRDEFGIHSLAYYQRAYELFQKSNRVALLFAEYEETPLAAVMVFACGDRSWYFYGASNNQHRNLMPTYLVQWEAMLWAQSQGCKTYDLWGVPDADRDQLEVEFTQRNDGLWGVYRFKRGFGGDLKKSFGAWDRVYNPLLYNFYLLWMRRYQS